MYRKKIKKATNLYKSVTKIISAKQNPTIRYKYIICKNCKHCIRLPKNATDVIATCPMCGTTFNVK